MRGLMEVLQKIKELTDDEWKQQTTRWMEGECFPFSVALKSVFPQYRVALFGYLVEDEESTEDEDNFDFVSVHAFCFHPSDKETIIDARGVRDISELYEEFNDGYEQTIDWDIPVEYLKTNYEGDTSFIEAFTQAKMWILAHRDKYTI